MGLLGNLFGSAGAGGVIKDTAAGIGGLAKDIRTAITGVDPTLQAELEKLALQADGIQAQAQADINKIEAASPRFFVAGWRPAVGWTCVLILLAAYIVLPILQAAGVQSTPKIEMGELWPVLMGILGLGGMRSFEKVRGAAGKH
jgi:hypothetical protein